MNYPVIDIVRTGANIRTVIDNSGYSISDVADYLGATRSLIYRYIRGEVLPSTDRLLALSVLLNISINDILAVV